MPYVGGKPVLRKVNPVCPGEKKERRGKEKKEKRINGRAVVRPVPISPSPPEAGKGKGGGKSSDLK